ncbi:hypothetical protein QUF58_08245 [Anaerolineales bacterium HSG24]|nr:hypothetical protein [Anaerolineales bacterium HSG24]
MKQLHDINQQEQIIAEGYYNYQLAERNSGLKERWSLHYQLDMGYIHRAEVWGQVGAIRIKQVTHFAMTDDYHPKLLEMAQRIADNSEVSTQLVCGANGLRQSISMDEETSEKQFDLPENYTIFFPPVSAHGWILRQYDHDEAGRQSLPLVCVRMQPQDDLSLSIELRPIIYEFINEEEFETPAGQFPCRHYIRYDQHMEQKLWIDKNDMVIQWTVPYSPIMKWDYMLTKYRRFEV